MVQHWCSRALSHPLHSGGLHAHCEAPLSPRMHVGGMMCVFLLCVHLLACPLSACKIMRLHAIAIKYTHMQHMYVPSFQIAFHQGMGIRYNLRAVQAGKLPTMSLQAALSFAWWEQLPMGIKGGCCVCVCAGMGRFIPRWRCLTGTTAPPCCGGWGTPPGVPSTPPSSPWLI